MQNTKKTAVEQINNGMVKNTTKPVYSEQHEIVKFLHSISQKNYSEANKYLQSVIDHKLKAKISHASKEKFF